ncbi:MAG TPA: prolyl oligopeptidase family serine peptidase, partial [Gemmatimonadaceae bacterium]|nr:prolyl oligopeptidase family serine peptidase [Gemmatimonadaceae bacterium]
KRLDSLMAKPYHLKRDERVVSIDVSPNGKALILIVETRATRAQQTEVPQFVTKSGYTEPLRVRNKVGDEQPVRRVAHMSLPSGELKWLLVVQGDTSRPAGSVQVIGWNEPGTGALLDVVSRDNKTRWLHVVSDAGALRTVDTQRDSAWVARKSFENTACGGCAGWFDAGRRIWLVSEADGYAHLYTIDANGKDRKRLTSGRWEVQDVDLSRDQRSFIIHTSEVSPFERHAYRVPVTGGAREKLTTGVGGHTVTISPDGRLIADVYSTANRPPELFVADSRAGAAMAQLTTSPTPEWLSFNWIKPEIVMIPGSDGVQVPARIYRPADLGARPNGAAAIFVHGAGYLHNVHNYWSTYSREYMFNQLLASKGYVVLDIDYRGSAGYGRDWRTAIYRHMGGRDLQDHVDGSKYLQKEFGIDPERIGIYGGSYGGFITLMALFTQPKQFGAGAGLRSVTDWAHYNHPYTSNILNLPQDDSVAYRRSSPIYFAEGLEDPLLIAHGMVDVNVQFQDVVRLAQKLIELGKTDWEMAVYPVEDHAFVRPSSWTDEYRRIFELFERHLPRQAVAGADGDGTR